MQIKLGSVNKRNRLTEVEKHSGCVCSQLLPSNTPRKQKPAGCAFCCLLGGENHSHPELCQRQRHQISFLIYVSGLSVKQPNDGDWCTKIFSQWPRSHTFSCWPLSSNVFAKYSLCRLVKSQGVSCESSWNVSLMLHAAPSDVLLHHQTRCCTIRAETKESFPLHLLKENTGELKKWQWCSNNLFMLNF